MAILVFHLRRYKRKLKVHFSLWYWGWNTNGSWKYTSSFKELYLIVYLNYSFEYLRLIGFNRGLKLSDSCFFYWLLHFDIFFSLLPNLKFRICFPCTVQSLFSKSHFCIPLLKVIFHLCHSILRVLYDKVSALCW